MTTSSHQSPSRTYGQPSLRQRLVRACAYAHADEFHAALETFDGNIEYAPLRPPEVGLVMLRGRIGGDGAPFNLGEATVTRAAVKLDSGETGFSHILGRNKENAVSAALLDALVQRHEYGPLLEREFVALVEDRRKKEKSEIRVKADTTRVDFFTLVRGEDT